MGIKTNYKIPVSKIEEFIDWKPFFQSWELYGNFPQILNDKKVGSAARDLWEDAKKMLVKIKEEKLFHQKQSSVSGQQIQETMMCFI